MSRHHEAIKNDPRWKAARAACLERDEFRCVDCHKHQDELDQPLEADHILPLSEYPELAFEVENLATRCRPCHTDKGRRGGIIVRNTWLNPRYPELEEAVF